MSAIGAWSRGGMGAVPPPGKTHGCGFPAEDVFAVRDMPKPVASPALILSGRKLDEAMNLREIRVSSRITSWKWLPGGALAQGSSLKGNAG